MTTIKTYPWAVTDHLQTKEDMAAHLEAALEEGDPALVITTLQDIVRAQEINQGSQTIEPEAARSLTDLLDTDTLDIATLMQVLNSLGLRLKAIAL